MEPGGVDAVGPVGPGAGGVVGHGQALDPALDRAGGVGPVERRVGDARGPAVLLGRFDGGLVRRPALEPERRRPEVETAQVARLAADVEPRGRRRRLGLRALARLDGLDREFVHEQFPPVAALGPHQRQRRVGVGDVLVVGNLDVVLVDGDVRVRHAVVRPDDVPVAVDEVVVGRDVAALDPQAVVQVPGPPGQRRLRRLALAVALRADLPGQPERPLEADRLGERDAVADRHLAAGGRRPVAARPVRAVGSRRRPVAPVTLVGQRVTAGQGGDQRRHRECLQKRSATGRPRQVGRRGGVALSLRRFVRPAGVDRGAFLHRHHATR